MVLCLDVIVKQFIIMTSKHCKWKACESIELSIFSLYFPGYLRGHDLWGDSGETPWGVCSQRPRQVSLQISQWRGKLWHSNNGKMMPVQQWLPLPSAIIDQLELCAKLTPLIYWLEQLWQQKVAFDAKSLLTLSSPLCIYLVS